MQSYPPTKLTASSKTTSDDESGKSTPVEEVSVQIPTKATPAADGPA